MPDQYHSIQFLTPYTLDGTEEPIFGDDLVMVVTVKNPDTDPVPTAPIFHASMSLLSTKTLDPMVDAEATESDADRGVQTTLFTYSFNPAWTPNTTRSNVSPLPALPTNVYNFEYEDKMDTAQGYTSRAYFTTA